MKSLTLSWLALTLAFCATHCIAQLTESEEDELVDYLNHLRRNVVPKAGDMNGVLWDDNLAALAQKAAEKCNFQHYYDGPYAGLGENVYRGVRRNMTEILTFMFLERENYDYKTGACKLNSDSKYPMYSSCGHYLQLATASVSKVGCGIKLCSDGYNLLFCEFNKGYSSSLPYEAGEPGTKCRYGFATYTQNGLCYYKSPFDGTQAVGGALDCNLTCLNYGTRIHYQIPIRMCACACPSGFSGVRCESPNSNARKLVPNDCKAQLVSCQNGGTPTLSAGVCKCVCPEGHRGDTCQENILQTENSVYWYFGRNMLYKSYFPVDPSAWKINRIEATLKNYLTVEINALCKTNYQVCCPNSASTTSDDNFVTEVEFGVTNGYPANMLDGSLKVGVNYRLPDAVTATCGGTSGPYLSRKALLTAASNAIASARNFLGNLGVIVIKFE